MADVEKPYPLPLGPGVVARVQTARSAKCWLPDIEAYLAEQELSTELAPAVAALMDGCPDLGLPGYSLEHAVSELRLLLADDDDL